MKRSSRLNRPGDLQCEALRARPRSLQSAEGRSAKRSTERDPTERTNMTAINKAKGRVLTLPASIKKKVSELAREDGVSESAWMAAAAVEKIGSLSAADFFLQACQPW